MNKSLICVHFGIMIFFLFWKLYFNIPRIFFFMIKAPVPFYLHPNRHLQISAILKIHVSIKTYFQGKIISQLIMIYKHIAKNNDTRSFQKGLLLWRSHHRHPTWRMIRWLWEWSLLFSVVSYHLKYYYTFKQEEDIKPIKLPVRRLNDSLACCLLCKR